MQRLHALSEKVSLFSVYVGGSLLIGSAALVAAEVVLRKLFSYSLASVDEISGYVFSAGTTWAFSYALFRRAHIRIDALYVRLSPRVCCILDVVALLSLAAFFTLLAVEAVWVLQETLHLGAVANTPLRTPLWMPQVLWMSGLWFFVFNIYLLALRSALSLARGRLDEVREIAGAPSLHEEVSEEVHLTEETLRQQAAMGEGGR